MNTNHAAFLVALAVAAAGSLVTTIRGQAQSQTEPMDLRPTLVVFTVPGYSAEIGRTAGAAVPLMRDESWGVALASGVPLECNHTLQVSVGGDTDFSAPAGAAWTLKGRLVSFEGGTATIDLRWTRRVHDPSLQPGDDADVEQRLVLREGGRGILDRVSGPVASACPSFAIGVGLELRSDGDVADAGLEYDLWLVSDRYPERAVRARANARQAEPTSYAFQPLELGPDGWRTATSEPSVTMNWSGSLVGRARRDGTIDLSVDAVVGVRDAEKGLGTSSHAGRQRVRVRDGETVEFEFPASAWQGLAPAHARERTGLRITARRAW